MRVLAMESCCTSLQNQLIKSNGESEIGCLILERESDDRSGPVHKRVLELELVRVRT